MRVIPLRPSRMPFQVAGAFRPRLVTAPTPVITTLGVREWSVMALNTPRRPPRPAAAERRSSYPPRSGPGRPSLDALRLLREIDRLTDGFDLLGLLIGDRGLELVLELHDQFDLVQAVGVQVVHKAR